MVPYSDQYENRSEADYLKTSDRDTDRPPFWYSDIAFATPKPIVDALQARIAHSIFGYGSEPVRLREVIVERMARLYQWQIVPDDIIFLPDSEVGLNVVARAFGEPRSGVLVNTPVDEYFISAPANQGLTIHTVPLACKQERTLLHHVFDMDALDYAAQSQTKLFFLCNPHFPVGRAYTLDELLTLGEFCINRNLIICADESYSDLVLAGAQHIPLASLAPEISQRTITLISPNRMYNISGLGTSVAIIQNPELRGRVKASAAGIVPEIHSNILGMIATEAAYEQCSPWSKALVAYLTSNRDFAVQYIVQNLPQLSVTNPEATHHLWIDCRNIGISGEYVDFFRDQAGVAVSDGESYGYNGQGFVQMSFGYPRSLLHANLERIKLALA